MKPSDGFPAFLTAAVRAALTAEVETTPKPGLVDLHDNGSHRDMDCGTFRKSAAAISPFLGEMGEIGREWGGSLPELFGRIRPVGVRAEDAMFAATGGVNTHKGATVSRSGDDFCRRRSSPPPGRW